MQQERMWGPFWIGFILAGVVAVVLYRQWQEQQAATERPLTLHGYQPPAEAPGGPGVHVAVRAKDDLTAVKGIGPVYARRLEEAGVHTFEDLAGLAPEELRALIGLRGRDGLPESWISQAQALAVSRAH